MRLCHITFYKIVHECINVQFTLISQNSVLHENIRYMKCSMSLLISEHFNKSTSILIIEICRKGLISETLMY